MADDGMVLNFEVGAVAPKPRAKVTGGRWRDRVQANKSLKASASAPMEPPAQQVANEHNGAATGLAGGEDGVDERPVKRVKFDSSRQGGGGGGRAEAGSRPPRKVTSSIFSFNPAPITQFDEDAEEKEDAEPSNAPLPGDSFKSLGLSDRLVAELGKLNLDKPTAVQKKTIPLMINTASDAFIQAETGSGKTLAYLLPMLQRVTALSKESRIHRDSGIFGIVLTPTRELAKQTYAVMSQLLKSTPWLVASPVIGGESKKAEKARIRKGVNFLIATPGRLCDHLQNTKVLKLSTVRWLILDEGDRLMELGFEDDIQKVISQLGKAEVAAKTYDGASLAHLPDRRITVLCSATMKMGVQKLGDMSLKDAFHVEASKEEGDDDDVRTGGGDTSFSAPAQLKQSYVVAPAKLRLVTLVSYLKSAFARKGSVMKAIVFISCADSVDFHFELLKAPPKEKPADKEKPANKTDDNARSATSTTVANSAYITSAANQTIALHRLHGSLSQPIRTATLRSFSESKDPAVLITTDIASRGLDIPSVDLVIELDPAFSLDDHIHRVGRTARAGRPGKAVIFLLPGSEEGYVSLLSSKSGGAEPTYQPYDAVLQKGLDIPMELPFETHAKIAASQAYTDKAEALQLHFEQRLVEDRKRHDLGRNGFKSHVRAYATHVKEERCYFDMTKLHLGHVAKSFCLREAPGGIGNGIERKASRAGRAKRARDEEKPVDEDKGRAAYMRMGRMANVGASEFNLG